MLTILLTASIALASTDVAPLRGEPVALLERGVTSFGSDALDGWLYVYGGCVGEPHRYCVEGQSRELVRVNLSDPRHVERLADGIAVQGAPLVAWEGRLVRAGGMVARNRRGEPSDLHSVADAALYDPTRDAWSALPPMPTPRSSHDLEVVGGRLVAVGGWTLAGERKGVFATTAAILDLRDPEAGWSEVAAPTRRRGLAAARFGSGVLVVGGMDPDGDVGSLVEILDPATGAWTKGPELPSPAFGVAATSARGAVYASARDGVVWRLAPGDAAWTRAGDLAFPRFFHQLVADGDRALYALGGIDEMRAGGRLRHVEELRFERAPGPIVTTFELPGPLPSRNRFGVFARGNVVTFFGGNRSLRQHDFGREDFQSAGWALDLGSMTWSARSAFPEARQTIATLVAGETGLAMGGFGFSDGRAVARASAFRYDFAEDAWTPAEALALPEPRTQFGSVEHAGAVWVFGGLDYDPARGDDAFRHPVAVLASAADGGALRDTGLVLPEPRRAFACAALGGSAYLVGGMREEFELVEDGVAFDFASKTFRPIAKPRRARVSAELVALGGELFLCGGSSRGEGDALAPDRSIEAYDPVADRWRVVVEELPIEVPHSRAFALRDRLAIVTSQLPGTPRVRVVLVAP